MTQNVLDKDGQCEVLDRAAVLDSLNQALDVLDSADRPQDTCKKIFQEVLHKVEIVLGINEAPPHDPAFLKPGAHLSPLEQKYAQPRLYDHKHKDEYGIRAQ